MPEAIKGHRRASQTSTQAVVLEPLSLQTELRDVVRTITLDVVHDGNQGILGTHMVMVGDGSGGTPAMAYASTRCDDRKNRSGGSPE